MIDFKKREELKERRDALVARQKQLLQEGADARVKAGLADRDAQTAASDAESLDNLIKNRMRAHDALPKEAVQRRPLQDEINDLDGKRSARRAEAKAKTVEAENYRAADTRAHAEWQKVMRQIAEIDQQLRSP